MDFCEACGVPAADALGSKLFRLYEDFSIFERNKLVKAHILRYSINTLKIIHMNVKKYADSCYGSVFPIKVGHLNRFLVKCAESGKSYKTLESYVNSIRMMSKFLGKLPRS